MRRTPAGFFPAHGDQAEQRAERSPVSCAGGRIFPPSALFSLYPTRMPSFFVRLMLEHSCAPALSLRLKPIPDSSPRFGSTCGGRRGTPAAGVSADLRCLAMHRFGRNRRSRCVCRSPPTAVIQNPTLRQDSSRCSKPLTHLHAADVAADTGLTAKSLCKEAPVCSVPNIECRSFSSHADSKGREEACVTAMSRRPETCAELTKGRFLSVVSVATQSVSAPQQNGVVPGKSCRLTRSRQFENTRGPQILSPAR